MAERRGTKALELWCRRMTDGYPGVKIDNMTTSWRDGLAFCAMIHHFRPDLIEFEKLNKADVYYNNELAFTTAEKYLGIPALLDAEDMATYDVPDRLSILTYLSQFYQVFAAQDLSNRLKRPSPGAEQPQISKTPGPPPKMAHVVGVPKRDPCQKCQLPVFLAERLTVGKRVYHRTCLKCARCNSQLTPGSFYETEVDNEYCCETCPDEEDVLHMQVQNIDVDADHGAAATSSDDVQLRQPQQPPLAEAATTKPRNVRSSIADRLAFFEQSKSGGATATITTSTTKATTIISTATTTLSDAKLLQKSVSDEEKSKSLKRIEGNSSSSCYKLNSALSSFLTGTVAPSKDAAEGELDSEATSSSATDSISKKTNDRTSSLSDSEGDGEDLSLELQRPELPTTQPPQQVTRTDLGSDEVELKIIEDDDQQTTQLFTARAQVQLINNRPESEEIVLKIEESENESETGAEGEKSPISRDENNSREQNSELSNREELIKAASIKQKTEIQLKLSPKRNPSTDYTNNNTNNNHNNSNNHVEAENVEVSAIEKHDFDDVTFKNEYRLEPNDNNCLTKEEILQIDVQQMSPKDDEEEKKASNVEIESNETESNESKREIDSPRSTTERVNASVENVEMRTKLTAAAADSSPKKNQAPSIHLSPADEDIETTRRLSVVRARLHQFEVNANNIVVPDLDKDTLKSNDVDTKVNTRNSSTDKINIDGVANLEYVGNNLKANEVLINHMETEKSLKQVPENDNDEKFIATKEGEINIEALEKKEIPMEIDEEQTEEKEEKEDKEKAEIEQDVKMMLPELEELITPTERTVHSPTEKDFAKTESTLDTIEETTIVTGTENAKVEKDEGERVHKPQTTIIERPLIIVTPTKSSTLNIRDYPDDLNPFQSDDESDKENSDVVMPPHSPASSASQSSPQKKSTPQKQVNLNPFDSSDDEIELEKSGASSAATTPSSAKVPPPRPPPPRISRNPFGEDTEEDLNFSRRSSLTSSLSRKTPVPTPRNNRSLPQNLTPEPTPRLSSSSRVAAPQQTPSALNASSVLQNASDYYGSANSLSTPLSLYRNSDIRGSNNSLASSAGGTIRSRKLRRAPAPPSHPTVKELFPSAGAENASIATNSQPSTPGSSTVGTPKQGRKKRPAPAPPKPARLDPTIHPNITVQQQQQQQQQLSHQNLDTQSKNSFSYPLQSELDSKLSDEEKALLEGNHHLLRHDQGDDEKYNLDSSSSTAISQRSTRRLIPLDASLLLDEDDRKGCDSNAARSCDGGKCDDLKHQEYEEELNVVYRRIIIPPPLETPTHERNPLLDELNGSAAQQIEHNRQLEKLKDNKEAQNRNRQSQISVTSSGAEDSDPLYNKSSHGKWKRRKGPAPALPIPPRKVLQMLPLQEIKTELEIIEVQQQGLEKQGVVLEKMIRDRCEGANGELLSMIGTGEAEGAGEGGVTDDGSGSLTAVTENSKEVEDLILQLFELVNEKNELFRRQAELMYLRRQHRLEQEQADIEYEIRVLMAQPERNKTDSDKAREEALIARLVEVVQLRNEVVECLEMDRLREAEEDMSIKKRLELHTAQREGDGGGVDPTKASPTKLSKKEKKKQKETKKLVKSKKLDVDKDADETELKTKKKKKKFLF